MILETLVQRGSGSLDLPNWPSEQMQDRSGGPLDNCTGHHSKGDKKSLAVENWWNIMFKTDCAGHTYTEHQRRSKMDGKATNRKVKRSHWHWPSDKKAQQWKIGDTLCPRRITLVTLTLTIGEKERWMDEEKQQRDKSKGTKMYKSKGKSTSNKEERQKTPTYTRWCHKLIWSFTLVLTLW